MLQIIASINLVETEKNPGPPIYVGPNKTIAAPYSQGNELGFGQNAGQQCVAMSLCSLIYNNKQGISSANDLIQIMNIGNQCYSSLSRLAPGGTPLFGLYGDVPLDRVWFFGLAVLNRVCNLTCL